jgi:hypothetical protein
LGERLLCKQEVDGSSPFTSTRAQGSDDGGRMLGAVIWPVGSKMVRAIRGFLSSDLCALTCG